MPHNAQSANSTSPTSTGFVRVRGAREHNLKNVDVDIPRDALVVFTGVSGSGKSSLAFGTLYAEAQRRYLESVAPYARRLFHQMGVPEVDEIDGLPPAVALQQQRGSPTTRSSVGSVTTLSNLLRMLYSRAGDYPPRPAAARRRIVFAEHARRRVPALPRAGARLRRDRAVDGAGRFAHHSRARHRRVAACVARAEPARHCDHARLRHRHAVARAAEEGSRLAALHRRAADRAGLCRVRRARKCGAAIKRKEPPSYMGTFTGAQTYVLETFAKTESASMKKRVARYMVSGECPVCHGKRLRAEALSVKFAGLDIAEISNLPLKRLADVLRPYAEAELTRLGEARGGASRESGSSRSASPRISCARLAVLLDLGLGYLSLDRSTPTLSPGELQRLRLATQVRSNLFGVVYVLDEPSAGLHPADTEALLAALDRLKASGNSLFVVEHELDVIRHADWIVDVGPAAGEHGGEMLYSGPLAGLEQSHAIADAPASFSATARHRDGRRATPRGLAAAERRDAQQSATISTSTFRSACSRP